jgi:hypothetical protein
LDGRIAAFDLRAVWTVDLVKLMEIKDHGKRTYDRKPGLHIYDRHPLG